MKTKLILAGVLAAVLPSAALAQPPDPNCVRSNRDSRVQGTVLGGVAGALIGGAIGHGAGAAVGGLTGAVAGNAIAGSRNDPCPPGYYYGPNGPPPPPPGYNGYNNGYGPPQPNGYYGSNYVAPNDPGYGHFWSGAPQDIGQRIDYMRNRIDTAQSSGMLNPDQAQRAHRELHNLRDWMRNRYNQNGGYLTPDDRGYIQADLDHIGASIHWMARTGY